MGVIIKVTSPALTASRMQRIWQDSVSSKVADTILEDCNVYVRMQSGDLADSAKKEENGKKITWNTPYAKRVYYTGTPKKNVNPLASLRWCEQAKRMHQNEWAEEASELFKG